MAVDFFLKLDGVEGESADEKHKGEIDLESWSWGCSQSGTFAVGGGGGAGKVSMQDFSFTTSVSKADPKLVQACATGTHIKKAVLTCRKAGKEQQEYLQIIFTDCLVSSYQTGGASHSEIPNSHFSLNYAKMELLYKEQLASGQLGGVVKAGYDLKLNKAV
jgi:type VI secretion system secreted protein Hcp